MTAKPILISGAGLGGLLLARSLRTSGIPFLIYERDADVFARAQGYRIRISTDGINALKSVLTTSQFEKFKKGTATTGGGGIHNLNAFSGEETKKDSSDLLSSSSKPTTTPPTPANPSSPPPASQGLGGDVLGVARGWLRQCLVEDLQDMVHWNKKTVGYKTSGSESDDRSVSLEFSDGTSSPQGCLLVAADGPQSSIAKQLTHGKVRAYDTGSRMIHGQSPAFAFKKMGHGVWFVEDDSKGPDGVKINLITNVRPDIDFDGEGNKEELGWVIGGGPGSFDAPGGNFSIVGSVAADLSRQLSSSWNDKFKQIFIHQNDKEAAFLKMSTAWPEGIPEWDNDHRVTLLGDCVHCMTPAGGVGANTALRDAALLGKLLNDKNGWYNGVTDEYEKEMKVYANENVKMSYDSAAKRFNFGIENLK